MTSEDIIRMARDAAALHGHTFKSEPSTETIEFIMSFYDLVSAAEREACAKICDEKFNIRATGGFPREASASRALAEEIRARGK